MLEIKKTWFVSSLRRRISISGTISWLNFTVPVNCRSNAYHDKLSWTQLSPFENFAAFLEQWSKNGSEKYRVIFHDVGKLRRRRIYWRVFDQIQEIGYLGLNGEEKDLKAGSITNVLQQALHSRDKKQLAKILNYTDQSLIKVHSTTVFTVTNRMLWKKFASF